jgi:hypothetical protein
MHATYNIVDPSPKTHGCYIRIGYSKQEWEPGEHDANVDIIMITNSCFNQGGQTM